MSFVTDGSKLAELSISSRFRLPDNCGVFQAEVAAIKFGNRYTAPERSHRQSSDYPLRQYDNFELADYTEGLSKLSISNIELLHDKTGAPLASCS